MCVGGTGLDWTGTVDGSGSRHELNSQTHNLTIRMDSQTLVIIPRDLRPDRTWIEKKKRFGYVKLSQFIIIFFLIKYLR